ncbi:MAG TPA: hypothetical protein VNQ77_16960 [Frankiaceae bacterium]|nr:hypothetical protein [Frankiaceae bacterium]
MGRFGRGDDAPRVVGFDFGAPPPAPSAYVPDESTPPPAPPPTPPVSEYAAPPVYATAPPYQPSYAPQEPQYSAPVQTMPMAYVPPGYAMPQPMPAPVPEVKTRSGIRRELTILGVLLGLIAALGVAQRIANRDDDKAPAVAQVKAAPPSLAPQLEDLNAPPSVGGEPRMGGFYTHALARSIRKILPNNGRHSEIEDYGSGEYPTYLLIGGELSQGDARRIFDFYLGQLGTTRYGPRRMYAGNVLCARYDAGETHGSVCTWATKVSDGIVFGYTQRDPAKLARVTVQARRDLERGR